MWTESEQQPVDPKRAFELGVGVASPLWPGFLVAASAGVAFWWWSQWARGSMLNEAQLGALSAVKSAVPTPPTKVVFDPVAEAPVVIDAAPAMQVVEAMERVAQDAAKEMDKAIEALAEAPSAFVAPSLIAPAPARPVEIAPLPPVKAAAPAPAPEPAPVKAKPVVKVEAPKVEPPKSEPLKVETPKPELAKAAPVKAEPVKVAASPAPPAEKPAKAAKPATVKAPGPTSTPAVAAPVKLAAPVAKKPQKPKGR